MNDPILMTTHGHQEPAQAPHQRENTHKSSFTIPTNLDCSIHIIVQAQHQLEITTIPTQYNSYKWREAIKIYSLGLCPKQGFRWVPKPLGINLWTKFRWFLAPKMSYPTPHYYPKYEIWTTEKKLVNNPFKKVVTKSFFYGQAKGKASKTKLDN